MLKIRLQRIGRTNVPAFRIVLTDSQNSTKSGKYLEILGSYDPIRKTKKIESDRIKYWISKGAQATETMHNFLIKEKIISGKKINVLPVKSKTLKRKELKAQAGEKKKVAPAAVVVALTEELKSKEKTPETTTDSVKTEVKTPEAPRVAEPVK